MFQFEWKARKKSVGQIDVYRIVRRGFVPCFGIGVIHAAGGSAGETIALQLNLISAVVGGQKAVLQNRLCFQCSLLGNEHFSVP